MRYASVCDGIGAVHVAWQPLGWHCEWTAEIDAFPAAVVEQRWGFPNRGDMTRFKEWDDAPIELLVGGTPCQSFSVAGLRKGLHDPRGGLMLTFLEIAQRYRPQWVVWENVPGVLSSNGGRDFGAFLGALGELGYGWAYRVLDAQWFGVAQRRRRVFVVGCAGDERRAAQVLFESESVRRDNPPSRASRKETTGSTGDGVARCVTTGEAKRQDWENCNFVASHTTQDAHQGRLIPTSPCVIDRAAFNQGQNAQYDPQIGESDLMSSLVARGPHAVLPQAFYSNESRCDNIPPPDISPPVKVGSSGSGNPPAVAFSAKDHGGDASEEVAPTMRSMGHDGSHANGGGQLAVAFKPSHYTRGKDGKPSEVTPPLSADADKGDQDTVVAAPFVKAKRAQSTTDDESWVPGEVAPTFNCFDQGDTRATTVVAFANRTRDGIKVPEVMKDGVTPALTNPGDGGRSDAVNVVVPRPVGTDLYNGAVDGDVAHSVRVGNGNAMGGVPSVMTPMAFAKNQLGEVRTNSEVMGTVNTNQNASGRNTPMVMQPVGVDFQNCANTGDVSGTLMGEAQKKGGEAGHGVMQPLAVRTAQTSANGHGVAEGVCHTLDQVQGQAVMTPMAVRRLTPRECERLQGFPDDYTAITYRKKPAADGPRYKALGNSMAVPVMSWIGQRIAKCAIH